MDKTTQLPQSVPQDPSVRQQIRDATRQLVNEKKLLPPQTKDNLEEHACDCLATLQLGGEYLHYTMILLNNALWEDYFTHIPNEERLLLLPICQRNSEACNAPSDELGLLCAECGACNIPTITAKAEAAGMSVLVAESSSRVSEWVEDGEIQGIIGVSCLHSLEKAFPSMLRHAVPGIAVPLITDGCKDTELDRSALDDALAIPQDPQTYAAPGPFIREQVRQIFTPERIRPYLNTATPFLQRFGELACGALCDNGKHYRPLITFGTYCALLNRSHFPGFLEPIAIAIECFHKASLIHDDIEDDDDTRYDEPALHKQVGVATALNLGDFLIGEGYRLLSHPLIPAEIRADLYAQAAQAHCELALGQAQEFESPDEAASLEQCIATHRLKTAPAFRVAMYLGAIAAGKFAQYREIFHAFSDVLGVGYQLVDDLDDTEANSASAVDCVMQSEGLDRDSARDKITRLYQTYRQETYAILEGIDDPIVKTFLYRLSGRILRDV